MRNGRKQSETPLQAVAQADAPRRLGRAKPGAAAVELANVGLMGLAFAVACIVPFELFLFAYAVLGPLHYATEISWLYDRRFFAPRKSDWLLLGGVCDLDRTGKSRRARRRGGSVAQCNSYRGRGNGRPAQGRPSRRDVLCVWGRVVFVLTGLPAMRW